MLTGLIHNAPNSIIVGHLMSRPEFEHLKYSCKIGIVEKANSLMTISFELIDIVFDEPEDETYFLLYIDNDIRDMLDISYVETDIYIDKNTKCQ